MLSLIASHEAWRRICSLPPDARWVYGYYLFRPLDLLLRRGRVAAKIVLRTRRLPPSLEWEKKRQRIHRWVEGKG
jgi:hypothetical protein